MPTKYEQGIRCLINFNATRGWRDAAHDRAAELGLTLTSYIKRLVDQDMAGESTVAQLHARIDELETANSSLNIAVDHWRHNYKQLELLYNQVAGRG